MTERDYSDEALKDFKIEITEFTDEELKVAAQTFQSLTPSMLADLTTVLQGWTDPLGQIASWIYDRLKEIASWFASTVDAIMRSFYNTIVVPALNALSTAIGGMQTVINAISKSLGDLASVLQRLPSTIQSFVADLSKAVSASFDILRSLLSEAFSSVTRVIGDLGARLLDSLKSVWDWLRTAIESLGARIFEVISTIARTVGDVGARILDSLKATWDLFRSALESLGARILDSLLSVARTIGDLGARVFDAIRGFWDWVKSGIEWIGARLAEFARQTFEAIQAIGARVFESLKGFWDWVKSGIEWIAGRVSELGRWLWEGIQALGSRLIDSIRGFWDWVRSGIEWIGARLAEFGKWIWEGIQGIASRILESLRGFWEWMRSGIETLSGRIIDFGKWIWEGVQSLGARISEGLKGMYEMIRGAVESIARGLSELWSRIQGAFTGLFDSLARLGEVFRDFAGYVYRFGAMVLGGISNIFAAIADLPNMIRGAFESLIKFFEDLSRAFTAFVSNPIEWIKQNVMLPVWEGLKFIGGKVVEGLSWLWEQFQKLAGTIVEWVKGFVSSMQAIFSSLFSWIVDLGRGVATALAERLAGIWEWIASLVRVPTDLAAKILSPFGSSIRVMFSELGISSPPYLTVDRVLGGMVIGTGTSAMLYSLMYTLQLTARLIVFSLRGIASHVSHTLEDVEISLKFLGAGGSAKFNLGKAMGATLHSIASEIESVTSKWLEYSSMGLLFWYGQALSKFVTYHLRNYIPIEIPTFGEILESLRRGTVADAYPALVGKSFDDLYDGLRYYLAVRGFSDYFIALSLASTDEFYVTLIDRFETKRKIPLALRYTLPSPSEVVRWLIRDVVLPPKLTVELVEKNLVKLLGIRGFPEDIAKLYYIAHFRYPPASAIAEFFWRAVARTLWLPSSMEEPEIAGAVGARYSAVSPRDLNAALDANYSGFREAIDRYWRWHDYAPFAWYPNFTTDKAIMVELTADLPRRIDLRWLMRWGIFEHLEALMRARGLGPLAPIPRILELLPSATGRELISARVTPEVSLDVKLLARLLEATGYHPDFVPVLSVAFAHQILTDEMTLVRTGFLSAYREGVLSLDASEKLLSGLITVKFYTGYIDIESGKWVDVTYNKPLLWLPGERRLLQLRSVFDRHVDLWRDFMREVVSGVRRLALVSHDAVEYMKKYFEDLSKSWSTSVKAISGIEWSPVLDEEYIALWIKYAELTRIIEARIWVRHYLARTMGWMMYRVSYGWLAKEDYMTLVKSLVERQWLTQIEADFFLTMFDWLSGIVAREYIPTPSTLATLSEYMVIEKESVQKVFEKLRVPEEFRPLYEEYIRVRPVKSDFKTLITAYRRARARGLITEDQWKAVLEEAKQFGFRDIELSIIQRLSDLESFMREADEYVPTLAQLVQFAEYTAIDEKLIDEVLKTRKVEEPWMTLWKRLITARVLADDVRTLLSAYYRAVRRGIHVPDDMKKVIESYFDLVGITKEERSIRDLATQLEITIDESKEYIPTLAQLIQLAEYIGIDEALIKQVLEARNVREPWAGLWKKLIAVRTIADDVRVLLSSYYRALKAGVAIPDDVKKKADALFSLVGITKEEREIRDLAAQIDILMDASREYVPTLTQLVQFAEYTAISDEMIAKVFEARNVREPWASLWKRLIIARVLSDDVRVLLSSYYRAVRSGAMIPDAVKKAVESYFALVGITKEEREIRDLSVSLDLLAQSAEAYVPTPSQLASIAEYTFVSDEMISLAFKARSITEPWSTLWKQAIRARAIADDVRALLTSYYRALKAGAVIPDDVKKMIENYFLLAGISKEEREIRDLAASLDALIENLPTLSTLVAMAEYIELPAAYLKEVLAKRRIEKTYAELWMRYIQVRSVATETSRIATAFVRLYERFTVSEEMVKRVSEIMAAGGWTASEMKLFSIELELRKSYRILSSLIPSVRAFVGDAIYLPNWEALFEDLLKTYGIIVEKYKAQVDYYKALVKNRRLWRHFSWWRTQLTYAYQQGTITKDMARRLLQKWKARGLVDDDEIEAIIEGLDLRAAGYSEYLRRYYERLAERGS